MGCRYRALRNLPSLPARLALIGSGARNRRCYAWVLGLAQGAPGVAGRPEVPGECGARHTAGAVRAIWCRLFPRTSATPRWLMGLARCGCGPSPDGGLRRIAPAVHCI